MSKPNPAASIIIPNYNHARFIGDAINSVLNQTCPDHEVIVVDDGSRDDSRQVIAQFGDKVNSIFQDNQGLSAARNIGIQAARGAFIGVLDADDMYEPDFIETLVSQMESRPDADGIYCGYRFVDEANRPLPQVEAREVPPDDLFQALVDGNFLVPEAMLVRNYCYEKAGFFDTSLSALEDLDMWLRIAAQFKIIHTTEVLTRHRILSGSMSSDPDRQYRNRMSVLSKHFGAEPVKGGAWAEAQRNAYGHGYLTSAVEYLQVQNESRAYDCIYSMVNACPDLLTSMETFYELGCGGQPKGWRGDFSSLDLLSNYQMVMRLLEKLSNAPELDQFKRVKRLAYANTYYAFGLLAYGQGRTGAARNYFLGALKYSPDLLVDRRFAGFGMRFLLGAGMVHRLKRLAGRAG